MTQEFMPADLADIAYNRYDDFQTLRRICLNSRNNGHPVILYKLKGTTTEQMPEDLKNLRIIVAYEKRTSKVLAMANPEGVYKFDILTAVTYEDVANQLTWSSEGRTTKPISEIQHPKELNELLQELNKREIAEQKQERKENRAATFRKTVDAGKKVTDKTVKVGKMAAKGTGKIIGGTGKVLDAVVGIFDEMYK